MIIGGGYPVVVQSMINEDTLDIDGSVAAIQRLHAIGCEIVRVTVPSLAHAKALAEIKEKLAKTYQAVPLVADVHHNGMKIALEVAKHVDGEMADADYGYVGKQPGYISLYPTFRTS